jgi:hypothetical protein
MVTVPSLEDWEKGWAAQSAEREARSEERKEKLKAEMPKLVAVDFRMPLTAVAQTN